MQTANASNRESTAAPGAPQARRRKRWVIVSLAVVLIVLLVLVMLLPTLLSTQPGNRTLIGWLNQQIAGRIEAERIRVGWLEGPRITNLRLLDPEGVLVADVPRLAAPHARPLPIVFGSRAFGDVTIDAQSMHVRQRPNEPTNLQLALAPAVEREPPDEPEPVVVDPDLSTRVQFSAERITYEGPDIDPVELTDVSASLDVANVQAIGVDLRSALRHDDVPGRIAAQLRLTDMFTDAGELQWRQGGVQADVDLESLPIEAVDRLMQMDGRLAALLGPQLDAQVRSEGPIDAMTAEITARSEHLNVSAQLVSDEQTLRSPGASLSLDVTPNAFARWVRAAPDETGETGAAAPEPLAPFTVELELASLSVPRRNDALALEAAAIDARGTIGAVRLRVPEVGDVALEQTSMNLMSEALGEQVSAQLETVAAYEDVREPVRASAVVRDPLGEAAGRELALEAEALPVVFADALGGMEGRLTETLGPTLSLRLSAAQPAADQFTFDGEIEAERLSGAVQGRWDHVARQGELSTPSPVQLTLTPAAYRGWVGDLGARVMLAEPMTASVNLRVPRLGLREPGADEEADLLARIDPQRTTIAAELTTPRLVVQDPRTQRRLASENVEIVVPEGSLDEALEMFIRMQLDDLAAGDDGLPAAQAQARQAPQASPVMAVDRDAAGGGAAGGAQRNPQAAPAASPGTLDSRTRLDNLVGAYGGLDFAAAHLVSELTATRIPSTFVDMLAQQEGQLAAVLGPETSVDATIDYQRRRGGTAAVDLNTTNAAGRLNAAIDPEGVAQLTEDAALQVAVTDEVSRVMLRSFNPLLGETVAAAAPIDLRLFAEGSAVPMDPFTWEGVNLRGQLNMPQLTIRAAGFLDIAFQAMRTLGGLRTAQQYQATLSPADFRIERGVLSYDNLNIELARGMGLNFAGDVNLVTQALGLDMQFQGDAYPREMRGMTLALDGTIDNPSLDEGRLAQLLVRQGFRRGLEELLPGRPEPDDEEAPEPDEQEEEPEPERRLPWEDLFERLR